MLTLWSRAGLLLYSGLYYAQFVVLDKFAYLGSEYQGHIQQNGIVLGDSHVMHHHPFLQSSALLRW